MSNCNAVNAIAMVAKNHHVSESLVKEEIQSAIIAAMSSSDPAIQSLWKQIPSSGNFPKPEELIDWIIKRL